MSIVLPKDLLQVVFPRVVENYADRETVEQLIRDYYERDSISVGVEVRAEETEVRITEIKQVFEDSRLQEASAAGEVGDFRKAERLLDPIREKYPWESDVHRMYAQSLFEQGRADESIEPALDAIRWDPDNVYALILAGNIYLRGRSDIATAKRLYDHAAALAPDNHLVLNNIGGALLQEGRQKEGKRYLQLALEANANYPRTHYGLALAEQESGNLTAAFQHLVDALKTDKRSKLRKPLLQAVESLAKEYRRGAISERVINRYQTQVAERSSKPVRLEERAELSETAKLEVAETHGRSFHTVVLKPGARHQAHNTMHELVHLDFICEAREVDENELFTSADHTRAAFDRDHRDLPDKLAGQGLSEKQIEHFADSIYGGILGHLYNAPIDLFIEQKLHDEFPDLRPLQLASLVDLMRSYIKSATDDQIRTLTPERIHRASTVLNLTHALHLKDLYGADFVHDFRAERRIRKLAEKLYEQFREIKDDRLPGEEYELIEEWGQKLGLQNYFDLVHESPRRYREESSPAQSEERGSKEPKEVMDEVSRDPHNLEDPDRPDGNGAQISYDDDSAGSMAVTMHLADAINFFRERSAKETQAVAFEIAMLGTQGIDPSKTEKRYTLNSVPNRKFSPLQLLAYMYVGFKELDESVDTQLDFEDQFQEAKEIANLDR